jgi:GNAT superfamily N-acetyltransferase
MHIRLATENDISEMHRVRISVRENRLSNPGRIQPDDYRSMLNTRGRGWVSEHDGRIVAFAVADLTSANVWALFVEPAFEGQGRGRKLHDTMMEWMFAEGASKVWLGTDPGTRAERFYQAAGWQYAGPEPSGEARYEMRRETWLVDSVA